MRFAALNFRDVMKVLGVYPSDPGDSDASRIGDEGMGVVTEVGATVSDLAVGDRVYGYLPMGTHIVVLADRVTPSGFVDAAAHRQPMSPFYNQYSRLATDPEHDPAREDARMLFGPLLSTTWRA